MAGTIYKLWMTRGHTEAKRQLSKEEWADIRTEREEVIKKVGGKNIVIAYTRWCSDEWVAFGVDEFPNIEALQEATGLWEKMDLFRYYDSVSLLGSEWRPS